VLDDYYLAFHGHSHGHIHGHNHGHSHGHGHSLLYLSTCSNPWINEVWRSKFKCLSDAACANKRIDWKDQMDTKVDFVFDAVLVFSDALERCMNDNNENCNTRSDKFFNNYILTTNLTGEKHAQLEKKEIILQVTYYRSPVKV
jgi:hypothetical protein